MELIHLQKYYCISVFGKNIGINENSTHTGSLTLLGYQTQNHCPKLIYDQQFMLSYLFCLYL